jgi:hypothetical protein
LHKARCDPTAHTFMARVSHTIGRQASNSPALP